MSTWSYSSLIYDDIQGLCCYQILGKGQGFMLQPEAIFISVVSAALRVLIWSVALLQSGVLFMVCADARNHLEACNPRSWVHKEQISYFHSDMDDSRHTQLRKRDTEDLCDTSPSIPPIHH